VAPVPDVDFKFHQPVLCGHAAGKSLPYRVQLREDQSLRNGHQFHPFEREFQALTDVNCSSMKMRSPTESYRSVV
jgi:hypothetical protein